MIQLRKVSEKRDIEVTVEGKAGNVKRRVRDFSKVYGLEVYRFFIFDCFAEPHSSIL
jgi:hypothetical protein